MLASSSCAGINKPSSLEILPRLAAAGADICAFDPEGTAEAQKLMPELTYCRDAYQAMAGADALVLLTEWNEFRGLDLGRADLRGLWRPGGHPQPESYRAQPDRAAGLLKIPLNDRLLRTITYFGQLLSERHEAENLGLHSFQDPQTYGGRISSESLMNKEYGRQRPVSPINSPGEARSDFSCRGM